MGLTFVFVLDMETVGLKISSDAYENVTEMLLTCSLVPCILLMKNSLQVNASK